MLGDISRAQKVYIITGQTDMRKSIDGLMSIVAHTFQLDPYSSSLFLFCGRRCDRIKALLYEQTGFTLLYKRLEQGRFQWPRDRNEAEIITRDQLKWLLQGLSIDQPKALKPVKSRKF